MKKIVLANFKANLSPGHADQWIRTFVAQYRPREDLEVVLAVPFLYLSRFYEQVRELAGVSLAAQGVSPYPSGGYTGATPAAWLKDLVQYAVLGHRERRKYFYETVQDVAAQVRECVVVGIIPVLCLGDKGVADVRAALDSRELAEVMPAYTPEHAMALEKARDLSGIQEGVTRVRGYFPDRPILYGGGVDADNGREILALPEVAGIMLGRGCLDGKQFVQMLNT